MAVLPPRDVPVVDKTGMMDQRWYSYFFQRDLANQPQALSSYFELTEITAPTNGAVNTGRLFTKDNGSGKTQLCIIFHTGVVQNIVTEP